MTTRPDRPTPDRSRVRPLAGMMALGVIGLIVVWWPGCRDYSAASSVASYGLMESLYTACNLKNPESLAKVEGRVDRAARDGTLSAPESDSFRRIIATAKAGRWADAEEAAYQFADDQRGRGLTDLTGAKPHGHGRKKDRGRPGTPR